MIKLNLCGGLGNQLFQYSFGLLLSARLSRNLILNLESYKSDVYLREYMLDKLLLSPPLTQSSSAKNDLEISDRHVDLVIKEPFGGLRDYNHRVFFETICQNLEGVESFAIEGYFSSEGFFSLKEDFLKKKLQLNYKSLDEITLSNKILNKNSQYIGVHVRRSEYGHHGLAKMSYYLESISELRNRYGALPAIIFTDEPNFCSFQFRGVKDSIIVSGSTKSPIIDFLLLSRATHFVLSNSSFSFWAALLGEKSGSEVFFPFPLCVWSDVEMLTTRKAKWNIVNNAVYSP